MNLPLARTSEKRAAEVNKSLEKRAAGERSRKQLFSCSFLILPSHPPPVHSIHIFFHVYLSLNSPLSISISQLWLYNIFY